MIVWIQDLLEKFLLLYQEGRPGFETVEELLKSVGLYESTQYPVQELLVKYGLSNLIIDELVTVRDLLFLWILSGAGHLVIIFCLIGDRVGFPFLYITFEFYFSLELVPYISSHVVQKDYCSKSCHFMCSVSC